MLLAICRFNPINATSIRAALTLAAPTAPAELVESVVVECGGDLRHALLSLQLLLTGEQVQHQPANSKGKKGQQKRKRGVDGDNGGVASAAVKTDSGYMHKDDFLGTLHALGKLLYAKRKHVTWQRALASSVMCW